MSSTPPPPSPPPPSPSKASPAPRLLPGVVHLQTIELTQLRAFEHIVLSPPVPPSEDRGQWIVLLGDNGMGKTTILRGVTLALASPLITQAVLGSSTVPFRRDGADVAHAAVKLRGRIFHVQIRDEADRERPWFMIEDGDDVERILDGREWNAVPLLFAYGGRRGSALGGYVTTAGWVIDLMARWLHRAERLGLPIATDFTKTMEGLVLVDEIDLFLHPHWQLRVIEDLRRVFPRMSFVVTTHNPLTLMGAREGEVFVLRRPDPEGPIQLAQIDLPPGIRADQVLTGPWFDLASTLDADTLQKLDRHRELLRAGTPETNPERRALEAALRKRLGTFADTSLARMALSVAAEVLEEMGKRYQELSPEERSAMRSRLKERLKARQGGGAQGRAATARGNGQGTDAGANFRRLI